MAIPALIFILLIAWMTYQHRKWHRINLCQYAQYLLLHSDACEEHRKNLLECISASVETKEPNGVAADRFVNKVVEDLQGKLAYDDYKARNTYLGIPIPP
jgi:hypothetical protein